MPLTWAVIGVAHQIDDNHVVDQAWKRCSIAVHLLHIKGAAAGGGCAAVLAGANSRWRSAVLPNRLGG
jgi:hypothetical protein